jgi:hypothetical protein
MARSGSERVNDIIQPNALYRAKTLFIASNETVEIFSWHSVERMRKTTRNIAKDGS